MPPSTPVAFPLRVTNESRWRTNYQQRSSPDAARRRRPNSSSNSPVLDPWGPRVSSSTCTTSKSLLKVAYVVFFRTSAFLLRHRLLERYFEGAKRPVCTSQSYPRRGIGPNGTV